MFANFSPNVKFVLHVRNNSYYDCERSLVLNATLV